MEGAQEQMGLEQAIDEIDAIMQEVHIMGANDSEIPQLQGIQSRLQSGELTIPEALEQAHEIKNRKATYH